MLSAMAAAGDAPSALSVAVSGVRHGGTTEVTKVNAQCVKSNQHVSTPPQVQCIRHV